MPQAYASLATHSLAILACTLASVLDSLAGAVLAFASTSSRLNCLPGSPQRRKGLPPLGMAVLAAVVATLGKPPRRPDLCTISSFTRTGDCNAKVQ